MKLSSEMDDFMETCIDGARTQLVETGMVEAVVFFRPQSEPDIPGNKSELPAMGMIPCSSAKDTDDWYYRIGEIIKRVGAKFSIMVAIADATPLDNGHDTKPCISVVGVEYDTQGLIMRTRSFIQFFEEGRTGDYKFEEVTEIAESNGTRLEEVTARTDLA